MLIMLLQLKKQWKQVKVLVNMSGFGWDAEAKQVTADDSVWDELLESSPEYKKWKNESFVLYERLDELCAKSTATGSLARDAGRKDEDAKANDSDDSDDSSDDEETTSPSRKRKLPSAVNAMGDIALALKGMTKGSGN
ncbi:unnamed protein product [Tilletia caries]|uniref:Myb/SANT-like domain-containing protein n=2 Tax=Tilletia TaxID=13289 RepID=A0ABN7IZV7_9BASI|nr:unnamed protein product [Tilletia caries]CAD6941610.1 unnamed protein product [Tilletia caries]